MANKVRFGLSNVYFAKRDVNAQGVVTYGTPYKVDGAIKLTLTRNTEKNVMYADNKAYYVSYNKSSREGTLEMALLPEQIKLDYLGYLKDTNNHLVETDVQGSSFALLFQEEGDESNRKYCIYNISAAETDSEFATKEENTTPATSTLNLTMAGETSGNVQVYIGEVDSFSSVTIPTFASL